MENNQQKTLDDILEVVSFIKDNAASKADLKPLATKGEVLVLDKKITGMDQRITGLDGRITGMDQRMSGKFAHLEERMTIKEDLTAAKTEIMTHVDDFITLHRKLETELVALQSKYKRLEEHLQFLAQHLHIALPE